MAQPSPAHLVQDHPSSLEKTMVDSTHADQAVSRDIDIDIDIDPEYSYAEQRRIIHRVDRRLITTLGFMYCVSLMDRSNLSNAAVAGMLVEMKLYVGFRYICFGFPNNWAIMIPLRLILGLLESGFFPGAVYLISTWYSRYDLQKRYSVFYLIGCLATAGAGILAYGFSQMDGLRGYQGWRWIFIMEGILTCVIAMVGYFFLVDFPDQGSTKDRSFLSDKERAFIIRRINRDRNDADSEPWDFRQWISSAADIKIWAFATIFFCFTTVSYALAYFLPIILRDNLGFSIPASQCLTAPPYILSAFLMYATAWLGDKYRVRGPGIVFNALISMTGLPIMGFSSNSGLRYFGVFLVAAGANANIPACLAYQANNIRGQWRRAFCSATLVGFGGIGGIAGSLVFRSQDAPGYRPGIYAAIACNGLAIIIVAINSVYFKVENKKADRDGKILEGDPGFRYTL
ncbi:hypothetical protein FOXYS1_9408 [Fusarium oxysporum]|uniref:Major facilitator superfamily (MFS) profile domain-containing protein n=1 Tax=Fusarium oxysporum TaxID=5507 RepID=A0A8H5A701_FUSOX|nr:hypothetical protein FOXYS1_9408 [Fusarium oxysporum]